MSRVRRLGGNLGAALVGAIVGALVMLTIDGATRSAPAPTRPVAIRSIPAEAIDTSARPALPEETVLLAWSPGGVPARTEQVVETMRGVTDATTVRAGLDWIERSQTSDGTILDRPPRGLVIPFEIAVIEPEEYARFVPASERAAVQSLSETGALLAESAAELRGASEGLQIRMRGRDVTVSAVVDDLTTNGYEALIAGTTPATWQRVDRYVLIRVVDPSRRGAIERRIRDLLGPGRVLRIRAQGETPFLRYGDAVLPQLKIKSAFGEFAARPLSTGAIEIDPRWRRRNIRQGSVPILGTVTCHRALFPQLRAAFETIQAEGLSFAIDPGDYGGCYSPRFIDSNPGGRLSHHSWGIAFDVNVSSNRPGTRSDQDPRVVEILEDAGFTWGGRWLIPDAMHFEWVRFP